MVARAGPRAAARSGCDGSRQPAARGRGGGVARRGGHRPRHDHGPSRSRSQARTGACPRRRAGHRGGQPWLCVCRSDRGRDPARGNRSGDDAVARVSGALSGRGDSRRGRPAGRLQLSVGVVVGLGGGTRHSKGALMNVPTSWLVQHADLLPRVGRALDVACGRGRHALWLAERGLTTLAIDSNADAVRELNDIARARRLPLRAEARDLERGGDPFTGSTFEVIVVVHYLHRPLFPALLGALAPGGLLVCETFTRAQAARGKPTNPDFLLEAGELLELVRPLEVLASREGDYDGRMVASLVARRTP